MTNSLIYLPFNLRKLLSSWVESIMSKNSFLYSKIKNMKNLSLLFCLISLCCAFSSSAMRWHEIAETNNEQLQRLIQVDPKNINQLNEQHSTPLHYAVRAGNEANVYLLLAYGADAIRANFYGITPLHYATWIGNTRIVRLLLEYGAYTVIDHPDKLYPHNTPFDLAIQSGRRDIVNLLRKSYLYPMHTFLMAMHPRSGQDSPARVLTQDMLIHIFNFIKQSPLPKRGIKRKSPDIKGITYKQLHKKYKTKPDPYII